MNRIQLLAIGETEPAVLGSLGPALETEFSASFEILEARLDPAPSLHPERQQYFSTEILYRMQRDLAPDSGRLLGVTPLDLYIPILTFVFGEAQLNGSCAVVSTYRLRQEFYGLPRDTQLLKERLLKESVHELGHTLGLNHCDDYRCVMAASHAVEAIDLKGKSLCADCRARALAALARVSDSEL
jgi:archaemetzincin